MKVSGKRIEVYFQNRVVYFLRNQFADAFKFKLSRTFYQYGFINEMQRGKVVYEIGRAFKKSSFKIKKCCRGRNVRADTNEPVQIFLLQQSSDLRVKYQIIFTGFIKI